MEIYWKNDKLKKQLEDGSFLESKYDKKIARKVAQRLIELSEAPNYAKLPISSGKHPIKTGKKFLYYAVDVPGRGDRGRGQLRLLFKPCGEYDLARIETIMSVVIIGLEDYHR